MRMLLKVLACLVVAVLVCSTASWAAQAQKAPAKEQAKAPAKETQAPAKEVKAEAKPKTRQATGEIVSVSDKELVLAKVRGKKENVTFTLTADTKKTGEMKTGNKVEVKYHEDAGKMIAQSVTVKEAKKAEEKKEAKPEKKEEKKPPKKS